MHTAPDQRRISVARRASTSQAVPPMAAGQMMLTSTVTVMFALSTFSMWTAATGFVICGNF